MKTSPKIAMIYVFLMICINHLSAQYTTGNFSPSSLINDGLKAPGRMAVDTNDYIYATDAIQKNIVKYDGQGNYIATITTTLSPLSIAINNKNQLFVGDKLTGAIYNVNPDGSKTLFYEGTSMPNSMVFGLNNVLYVVDSQLKKVIGLDVSGTVVKEFTYNTFTFPTGIAFDKQNSHIIVSEHGGIGEDVQTCGGGSMSWGTTGPLTTIYIFDIDGNLIKNFGCFGTKDGLFQRIQGITVGTCGNIYAVDPYLGRVNVFDDNGNYITKFGLQGNGVGEFNLPIDIVFTSNNNVFVSSMNKGAIDIFSVVASLPTATIISSDQVTCTGANAAIEVSFTGVAPWTFTYTLNGLNPQIKTATESPYTFPVAAEGLYEITALTDGNNAVGKCFTGGTNIQLSAAPPTVTIITPELSKCNNDDTGIEIQFTGFAPWTFTYTIDGLNPVEIISTNNSYYLNAKQSGLYEITMLSDAGCSGTEIFGNAAVTLLTLPTATVLSEASEVYINPGEVADVNISFTGNAPYMFTYLKDGINLTSVTTNDNPYLFNVSEEGNYKITSISDANCSNNEQQGYFDLIFNDIVLPTATMVSETICENDPNGITINFTGSGPWTFTYVIDGLNPTEITTSNSTHQLTPLTSGLFELVSVKDSLNNNGSISGSTTVNPLPIADYSYLINNLEVQFINNATNAVTHYWDFGDGTFSIEESPLHTYSSAGNYEVTYTATSLNCGSSDISSSIEVTGGTLSNDDKHNFKDYTLDIYPNPSQGNFTIKITPPNPIISTISIRIVSMTGQTIFSEILNPQFVTSYNGSIYKEINLSNFTKGIYTVYIQSESFVGQEKLILKD